MSIPASQIREINKLLLAYAAGKYHVQGKISKNRDEIDTIIAGVNMLGEELLDTTVSRDYFNSIYSSVADMIFVVEANGKIADVNSSVDAFLKYPKDSLLGQNITRVIEGKKTLFFNTIKRSLTRKMNSYVFETKFRTNKGRVLVVQCSCSQILNNTRTANYLIVTKDITEQKEAEKQVLRAIVETQEREQQRVAGDLHDSLGSELAMVKLLLSALGERFSEEDKKILRVYDSCTKTLEASIVNLRSICFDLMPSSLEKGNVRLALEELIDNNNLQGKLKFRLLVRGNLKTIEKSLEIVIYRIAQEFFNNSIKYSEATKCNVTLSFKSGYLNLEITDNGKGYNVDKARAGKGRGIRNMESRCRAFGGDLQLVSKIGQGTKLKAQFSLKNANE